MDKHKGTVKTVQLSKRLQALADMVTPGNVVADVGCDHGFLAIYLVQAGISPRVIAGDVRKGPLFAARKHVEERGLAAYIETRLSDGLTAYRREEAQTLICAGMGGRLMQRILTQNRDVAQGFEELILQPQSELRQFREFLREQGFLTLEEKILCEDGKYYFLFRVRPDSGTSTGRPAELSVGQNGDRESAGECRKWEEADNAAIDMQRLGDKYGALLLEARDTVLREYLEKGLESAKAVRDHLLTHRGGEGENLRLEQRLQETEAEIEDLQRALGVYE